jgi:hypothetical protein
MNSCFPKRKDNAQNIEGYGGRDGRTPVNVISKTVLPFRAAKLPG